MQNMLSAKSHGVAFAVISVVFLPATIWAVSSSLSVGITSASAQDTERSLNKTESYDNEPLTIVGIKASNRSVKPGEKFSGNNDWLKNASIRVQNSSEKDIVYIEIDLNFPETKTSGNEISYRLKLGHRPGAHDTNPPLLLKANDGAVLNLDDDRYDQLVKVVEQRHPMSGIRRVDMRLGFVIFSDGTAWSGGLFQRRDPNNPNRYIPMNN